MKNYVGKGDVVQFVAGAAISSGDIVVRASFVGIAQDDVANGATGVLVIEGEFSYTKATGTAHAVGDLLDYDVSADAVSKGITPATGDVSDFAVCTETAASGATSTKFKLLPGKGVVT